MKIRTDLEALISAALVRDLFEYDQATGFLVHRKSNNQTKIGSRAARLENSGYRRLTIRGRRYQEHRVIWLWMTGAWPQDRIDHRNTVYDDNRWENLRVANDSQNAANKKVRKTSKLRVKGVRLHECGQYQARIYVEGRNKHLGLFPTPEQASAAYLSAAQSLFGDYARS